LQKAGVPSAPVVDSKELFHDPHLRARDWFTPLRHPEAGTHDYPGYPLRVGGMRYRPRRASPLFGEHTQELLAEYANVPADEFAELIETGVTSTSPA
jgi:crotonobetainyl-CoA:carnitine CoA-transferase CaiB-like acyl-CoA transferase